MDKGQDQPEPRGLFVLPTTYEERMSFIEAEMIQTYQKERLDESRKRTMLKLVETAHKFIQRRRIEELRCSGSVNSGFATNDSDLDIAVILRTDWPDGSKKDALSELDMIMSLLQLESYCREHRTLRNARVPVVECKMVYDGLMLEVDIIPHPFGEYGFLNSRMLSLYAEIHPYVPILGIIVKIWARARGINNTRTGDGLSSYTYVVMLVAFLQRTDPPLLPVLQDCPPGQRMKGKYDFSFREDIQEDIRAVESWSIPLPQALFDFFKYYANFDWNARKVDIKQLDDRKDNEDFRMFIQDPFQRERNLTDVLTAVGAPLKLKKEIHRAYSILLHPQSSLQDLF